MGTNRAYEPPLAATVNVIALVKVKAGSERAFQDAVAKILRPTRDEAGNISYVYNQAEGDVTEFAFFEEWLDDAALDAHMTSDHMLQFFTAVGPLFEPGYPEIKRYHRVDL